MPVGGASPGQIVPPAVAVARNGGQFLGDLVVELGGEVKHQIIIGGARTAGGAVIQASPQAAGESFGDR